jgi:hypothetical protein
MNDALRNDEISNSLNMAPIREKVLYQLYYNRFQTTNAIPSAGVLLCIYSIYCQYDGEEVIRYFLQACLLLTRTRACPHESFTVNFCEKSVFPALMLLALWSNSDKKPARHFLVISFFAALQAVFMMFFALGLPLIA